MLSHEQYKSCQRLTGATPTTSSTTTANDTHHEIPSGKMVIQGKDRIYEVGDRKYLVLEDIEGNQKCEEVNSGKIVILKFIDYDNELGADYDTIELSGKFHTDSKNLHSQYILYFLDAFELRNKKKLCLVSEFFEEKSLRFLRAEKLKVNVSLSVVLQVLFQGLCALDALHNGSFVHADVKEDNFFVKSFDGKLIKIVLGDLGLSFKLQEAEKAVAKESSSYVDSLSSVTKTTGTMSYRDPLIINQQKICFKSDLWSLGITLLKFIFLDKDMPDFEIIPEIERYKYIDEKFYEAFQNKPEWKIIKEIIKGLLIENIDERWTINKVLGKMFLVKSECQLNFINTLGFEYNYSILRDEFRHEESVIITVLSHDGLNLRHVPKKHHSNKKIIMEAIHNNPAAYNLILGELKSDINIQKEVIKGDVTLMEYIPQKFNHEFQKLQLEVNQSKQTYSNSKITPSKQQCNDKKFVLEKVKCDGLFLKYVSENLKDDIEVVNTSLHQDGLSLQFVAEKLKNQKSIALKAIYQNPLALEYVSNDLRNDKEIVEYAVKRNGSAIKFASKSLRTDRNLIEMAAEADFTGEILSLLPELKNDIHYLRKLASLNEKLFLNFIFKYGDEFSSGSSSADLCFNGMIYYFVKLEAQRAFTLFREASLKGNSHAQYYLGRMYYHGDAVSKDLNEAKEWFKKAAEQGHVVSQHNVAAMESQGKPTKLLLEPAKCGYSYSQYALGLYYYINESWKESFYWFKKSAEQGHADAQFYLGLLYCHGNGTGKDSLKGFHWYLKSAYQGNAKAQQSVAEIYCTGRDEIPQDYAKSFKWAKKAAEQGHEDAQYYLGHYYEQGFGTQADKDKSFEWYLKSAQQGNLNSIHNVAALYYHGIGVTQNYSKALEWFTISANKGKNPESQYNLGEMYLFGKGTPINDSEAIKWFRKSANQNNSQAILALKSMNKQLD